jgi:hypothetical protein
MECPLPGCTALGSGSAGAARPDHLEGRSPFTAAGDLNFECAKSQFRRRISMPLSRAALWSMLSFVHCQNGGLLPRAVAHRPRRQCCTFDPSLLFNFSLCGARTTQPPEITRLQVSYHLHGHQPGAGNDFARSSHLGVGPHKYQSRDPVAGIGSQLDFQHVGSGSCS